MIVSAMLVVHDNRNGSSDVRGGESWFRLGIEGFASLLNLADQIVGHLAPFTPIITA